MKVEAADIGTGVYSFPEASQILRSSGDPVSSRQLRYWLGRGLASTFSESEGSYPLLTFKDLISLEVVRRLKKYGASLQAIRYLNERLKSEFEYDSPFAYEIFFTDGASIWAQVDDDPNRAIELVGKRRGHFVWREVITSFAKQIKWSEEKPRVAESWRLSNWVEIDPRIQFGAPVVLGTRIPILTIKSNLSLGSPEEVAEWYGIATEAVEGVRQYLVTA
jgi:uncharacterized protein (DUF433 family)/DNA-binding transcriptional MerR regulator